MIGPRWPNQRRLESFPPSPPSLLSAVNTPLTLVAMHDQSSVMFPLQPTAPSPISLFLPRCFSFFLAFSLSSMEHDHGWSMSSHVQAATHAGVRWPKNAEKIGSSSVDHGMASFAVGRASGGRDGGVARTPVSGHSWWWSLTWTSSFRSHNHNGAIGSRWK